MHKGKRGQHSSMELWFLVAAFALAAVAGVDLLRNAAQDIKGTTLEKNYIARDLSMAIEAVYASPGNIDYNYSLGGYYYYIKIGSGRVSVDDGDGGVSYRIIGVSEKGSEYASYSNPEGLKVRTGNFRVNGNDDAVKNCKKPLRIIISKRFNPDGSSYISFSGVNVKVCQMLNDKVLEGTCTGSVSGCE